jgi:hypothetical protein
VLNLWSESGALHGSRKSTPVWHTPQLIRHDHGKESALNLCDSDQEASIIILGDLGKLVNIVQFLKSGTATAEQIAHIGSTVGQAFALTHSQDAAKNILKDAKAAQILTHSMAKDVVWKAAIEPVQERLAGCSNGQKLYHRIVQEWQAPHYKYRTCLSLGDFTPGTILLQSPQPGGDLTPIIVDWEFAQLNGYGVNGDIAQFLASMCCEIIGARDNSDLYNSLLNFTTSFCQAYRDAAKLHIRRTVEDENLQLLRSAFILTGREIINQAFDVYRKSIYFEDTLQRGVWYVEHAGADMEEFIGRGNWDEVVMEEGMMLQSLFIEDKSC